MIWLAVSPERVAQAGGDGARGLDGVRRRACERARCKEGADILERHVGGLGQARVYVDGGDGAAHAKRRKSDCVADGGSKDGNPGVAQPVDGGGESEGLRMQG